MILGKDIHPQRKIYYLGAIVIEILKSTDNRGDFFSLYQQVSEKEKISMNLFTLTLDWLFLFGLIENRKGLIQKCF
ncbi:hypothetical protein EZS27_027862 [termite gut metagenome]|uniref:Uncharacterized protein n=1 Tax=termite gut metagenome TaxID=433724 RepID=A0A5J4QPR1_9ZZZZ